MVTGFLKKAPTPFQFRHLSHSITLRNFSQFAQLESPDSGYLFRKQLARYIENPTIVIDSQFTPSKLTMKELVPIFLVFMPNLPHLTCDIDSPNRHDATFDTHGWVYFISLMWA